MESNGQGWVRNTAHAVGLLVLSCLVLSCLVCILANTHGGVKRSGLGAHAVGLTLV